MSAILEQSENVNKSRGPFIDIGFGFMLNVDRITSIVPFIGTAVRSLYYSKRHEGKLLDATRGRKKLSVIILTDGSIVSSAYQPKTIVNRQI
jgi:regulator of extracellular matrix RemA (YlzA/DUF370 family)